MGGEGSLFVIRVIYNYGCDVDVISTLCLANGQGFGSAAGPDVGSVVIIIRCFGTA